MYRFSRLALWGVLVVVLVLVLDLAGFDYDYENDDEGDALRVCRRFTREWRLVKVYISRPQPLTDQCRAFRCFRRNGGSSVPCGPPTPP